MNKTERKKLFQRVMAIVMKAAKISPDNLSEFARRFEACNGVPTSRENARYWKVNGVPTSRVQEFVKLAQSIDPKFEL